MKAIEARKKALESSFNSIENEHNKVINYIRDKVNKGELSITLDKYLIKTALKERLEQDGYKVECYEDQRYGTWTKISW